MQNNGQQSSTILAQYGPKLLGPVPGPKARAIVAGDERYVSPSYTRSYPMVAKRGRGLRVEDVDGNEFLDFAAGIAVVSTGHCHPEVVAAIQKQAAELIHISGHRLLLRTHGDPCRTALGHRADARTPSLSIMETPELRPSSAP